MVGDNTEALTKLNQKPNQTRWDEMFSYIAANEQIEDVVVSGGDSYLLAPDQLWYIGTRLLEIPHVRNFRIATKGLCTSPSRTLGMFLNIFFFLVADQTDVL
jgi:lysine 2,3-aminomutase